MPISFKQLSPRTILAGTFVVFLVPFLIVFLFPSRLDRVMDRDSYVAFHNIAEFFSIMVSLSVFSVGWFTFRQSQDRHALFLSAAFLAVGLLDFMHTMSNAAMPDFLTPNSTNKSTQFWISARLLDASAFLLSAYIYPSTRSRWLTKKYLQASVFVFLVTVFTGIVFFPDYLPATAIPGVGLTPLKRYLELLIIALLAAAALAYWQRLKLTADRSLICYPAAFIICIFSEGAFASYNTGFDTYNVLGHIYKVAAFYLIYKGVFIAAVKTPYEKLANEERNRHLASFPQLNPNPVLEVDRAGEIVYCNPAAHRFLAVCGMGDGDCRIFVPPDMERILAELETQKESSLYREIIVGDRFFGQSVQLVPRFEKIRIYAYDITERKRAEVALKRAYEEMEKRVEDRTAELRDKDQLLLLQSRQAAMGEMIGNIAHQWRQPLNFLGLTIQQLPLFYDLGKINRELLNQCVGSSMEVIHHMSRTIDDFRNYFRPDREKSEFNVHDAIVNTLSLLEGTLQNPQINVSIVAENDAVIYGYQNEFSQVLLNILMNARDALLERSIADPRVSITICNEDGCAVVTISDSAGGIPEDIIDKIFDPYFTTKGPQQGTGVGLFMSKTIIEKNMGGRLGVRNGAHGAEFRIEVGNEN